VSVTLNLVIGTVHGIALLAAANKVPLLVTWDNRDVTEDLGEYIIRLGFKTELVEIEITSFGFSELNFKKFWVVLAVK
jgi:hypothetical protein